MVFELRGSWRGIRVRGRGLTNPGNTTSIIGFDTRHRNLSRPAFASYIPAPTDSLSGTPRRLAAKLARTGRRSRTRTHDD